MSYLPLQIIVSAFVAVILFRLTTKFKQRILSFSEFLGWLVIWLGVAVVFWLPESTSYLAQILGVGRGVDLAVYAAVLVLFYLVFRLYLRLDKQQQEITKLIRHLSVNDEQTKNNPTQEND